MRSPNANFVALLLWLSASAIPGYLAAAPPLAEVQQLIDQGQPEQALALLGNSVPKGKKGAQTLLLRSTARIMSGDNEAGEDDLREALRLDPSLRQAWLNLGAVEIAAGRYESALGAFDQAESLDPSDLGNQLNQGAVLMLLGRLDEASAKFAAYLEHNDDAASHYLVAGNYALGNHEPQAVQHLRRAFELDERLRLSARTDNKFVLLQSEEYRRLLVTDLYRPPASAHTRAAGFQVAYDRENGRLLNAVLQAMQQVAEPYDARVEANEDWALIWGELRIKVYNQAAGKSVVSLSAPAERMTADDFSRRSDSLLRTVYEILLQL